MIDDKFARSSISINAIRAVPIYTFIIDWHIFIRLAFVYLVTMSEAEYSVMIPRPPQSTSRRTEVSQMLVN